MLWFIYIGDQITEDAKAFAFFDTVTDRFIEFSGNQVFDDWEDFLLWREGEENTYPQHDLKRFWAITPEEIRPTMRELDDDERCDCEEPFPASGYCKFCGAHQRHRQ